MCVVLMFFLFSFQLTHSCWLEMETVFSFDFHLIRCIHLRRFSYFVHKLISKCIKQERERRRLRVFVYKFTICMQIKERQRRKIMQFRFIWLFMCVCVILFCQFFGWIFILAVLAQCTLFLIEIDTKLHTQHQVTTVYCQKICCYCFIMRASCKCACVWIFVEKKMYGTQPRWRWRWQLCLTVFFACLLRRRRTQK